MLIGRWSEAFIAIARRFVCSGSTACGIWFLIKIEVPPIGQLSLADLFVWL